MILLTLRIILDNIGFVYILYYPRERLVKIGRSSDRPLGRFLDIYDDLPGIIIPIGFFPVFNYKALENNNLRATIKYKKKPKRAGPAAGASEFRRLPLRIFMFIYFKFIINTLVFLIIDTGIIIFLGLLLYNNNFQINLHNLLKHFNNA